jgi:hypothetical protein
MDASIALLIVGVLALGAWWWHGRSGRGWDRSEVHLRQICLGNTEQVERLIALELTRHPGISRGEAARRAVQRYRNDNR